MVSKSKITKKKRGRPSLSDLHNRQQLTTSISNKIPNPHFPQNPNQILPRQPRSSRRTPNFVDGDDDDDDDDGDDDDVDDDGDDDCDDRLHKKVKFVGLDPPPISHFEDEKGWKGTDTENGITMLVPGPTTSATTPLPGNKFLLLLILDKLQKKDTRGVFAEPVDPEELPDYHEVIENPMDFGTVRKKLDSGAYLTLEQFEADINLICSNAMEYNAPSTIYFRQARSIQEVAKKEFDVLRQESGNSEPPPRPRRGRPPGSRNMKKLLENSALDHTARESSSDAPPASRDDDDTVKSNSYNLRKGPSLYRFPRNLETSFDFAASASKFMPMKSVERQYDSEESRLEMYNRFDERSSDQAPSLLSIFGPFEKNLISVGLDFEHTYARSLAHFATDLGPAVWRIVSKKLRRILPPEVEVGPGWVGQNKIPFAQLPSPLSDKSVHSRDLSPANDWSLSKGPIVQPGVNPGSKVHSFEPNSSDGSRSLSSSNMNPSAIENEKMGVHGVPYWQNVSIQERWDLPYESQQQNLCASDSKGSSLPLDLVLQL